MRRTFLILCLVATVWALVVMASGGFVLWIGETRVLSSREPWNAGLIALLTGSVAVFLTPRAERQRLTRSAATWVRRLPTTIHQLAARSLPARVARRLPRRTAPALAVVSGAAVVLVGVLRGAPYVGGADVYGYVSQSQLWAAGTLYVPEPLMTELDWPFAAEVLSPLGYRPSQDRTAIVPIYPPGYPMSMAAFARVAGRDAVFYVVPLLGGLAVWAAYLMGSALSGPMVGAAAAVLLATSPTFLFQLMLPMSDVPVTAWWALSLACVLREGNRAALASGLAAGAAILTRPNLVPMVLVPGLLLLLPALRERSTPRVARALLFGVGTVPACLLIALLNVTFYGSPLSNGYGTLEALYAWRNLLPNLERYPLWLVQTQTPLVLLAIAAPWLVSRVHTAPIAGVRPEVVVLAWLAFVALTFLSYVFHTPNSAWFWLRYLLPAFPALLVLTGTGLAALLIGLDRGLRVLVTGMVIGAVAWHGVLFAETNGVFRFKEGERKSLAVGAYIASELPSRAIFICLHHSGSVRYYSGRLTVRYDLVPPEALDDVIRDLEALGYRPYILLEQWEESGFKTRFGRHSVAGRLDWPPAVFLDHSTTVRIYDPVWRDRPAPDRPATHIIR